MISMTGFGYCEEETERFYAAAEIKSYNNRYLDLQVNLPPFLSPLEPRIREHVGDSVRRGRVEVYIRMRELEEDLTVHLDRKVASEYSRVLRELSSIAGTGEEPGLAHLLGLEGVLKSTRSRNIDSYWDAVRPLLDRAVADFRESRLREGGTTQEDILKQIEIIESSLARILVREGELESYFTTTVRERFREVLGNEVDEQRMLTEIAALLVKYTINEELVRLRGHIESFRSLIDAEEAVGKKLDFLAQEIHREINTIGSKSVQYDISSEVVTMKDALEKIREQLRNVE
jgi:uncharacterized protein (TIGR00255 family)